MGLINLFFSKPAPKEGHRQMEVSQITPSVYVGTNACCTVHYKVKLIEQGILHDVSLEGERIDAPFGAETFLWLPTEDHAAPTTMDLRLGVDYVTDVLAQGGKVYVHCKNGHGRAPTLVAAWFIATQGKTVEEAIAEVKAKRPETHIEPAQVDALKRFASRP